MSKLRGSEFAGKRIAVIGLAATGLATAKVLSDLGAIVTVYDARPEEKLEAVRVAEVQTMPGVTFRPATDTVERQTDLVVPSPGVPRYAPVLTDAQAHGIPILGEIEIAYRLATAPILAITGTNGKTTTAALVGAICREAGLDTYVAGNIAEDAGKRLPLIEAAVAARQSDSVIVAEISSFQLEWVEQFRPKVAAWLNLSPDHLDRHKDMDEYARAKSNILRWQNSCDHAVLNVDDEMVIQYGMPSGCGNRWLFSLYNKDFLGDYIEPRFVVWPDGNHIYVDNRRTQVEINHIPLIGKHNLANTLAAVAIATAYGINEQHIQRAIYAFRGVAHRMEFVAEVNEVRYINNSMCTNPAAVIASADAAPKPLIAIAGGVHKGGDLSEMANALAKNARHIVLIGVSAPEIKAALVAAGAESIEIADTLPYAVERATKMAVPGDTVMLIPGCASFDMFSGFEERGQVFRDSVVK